MPLEEDDDSEPADLSARPDLRWEDGELHGHVLRAFNRMRKNRSFCDVVLQVEQHDLAAHRIVLAAVSPYFLELFTSADQPTWKEAYELSGILYKLAGFEKRVLELLVDYAYTSRLEVPADLVKSVYATAVRLRMDGAARECAHFLASYMDVETCLELRGMLGFAPVSELARRVDDFIAANMAAVQSSRQMRSLPRVRAEVLHASRAEMESAQASSLCQLTLDWVRSRWMEDEELTLAQLTHKTHMLYLGKDNSLQDCEHIQDGSEIDSEIIKEYKDTSKEHKPNRIHKVQRNATDKPAKPRELLFSRRINQDEIKTEEKSEDWKLIACFSLDEKSIVAIVSVDGHVASLSLVQRVNTPAADSASNSWLTEHRARILSGSRSPIGTQALPGETELFVPLSPMNQAKAGAGAACLNGSLIVCGGFDRLKCMKSVEMYDVSTNTWSALDSMQKRRGRFDVATDLDGGLLYAAAGSNGQADQHTVETFDWSTRQWTFVTSLPTAVSNMSLCNLDGRIYCVGGTQGQSGSKQCFRLVEEESRWERMSSLHVGRSQAALTSFQGLMWVVGGCDAWNPISSVEVYDPESNTWRMGPSLSCPRRGCGIVAKEDLLYVFGGSDGQSALCTTEVFDPRTNTWSAGPNMTTRRVNVSGALVANKIWAVGGFSGKSFLSSIEFLDPDRNEWTTFVPLELSEPDEADVFSPGVVDERQVNGPEHGEDDVDASEPVDAEPEPGELRPNCGD